MWYSQKMLFSKDGILTRRHSKEITFLRDDILKIWHSQKMAFSRNDIFKRWHSQELTFSIDGILKRWYSQKMGFSRAGISARWCFSLPSSSSENHFPQSPSTFSCLNKVKRNYVLFWWTDWIKKTNHATCIACSEGRKT